MGAEPTWHASAVTDAPADEAAPFEPGFANELFETGWRAIAPSEFAWFLIGEPDA